MQHKKTLLILALTILALPLISAQFNWGYGYSSPLYFLENEWVLFAVLFLIFLAVIFYTVNKTMKNPAVAMIIAFGISLLISMAIAQRGLIDSYGFGNELGSWLLLIAALIGIAFLIKFAAESFGWVGAVGSVIGLWLLIYSMDAHEILPSVLLYNYKFMGFYENFLKTGLGLVVLVVIALLLSKLRKKDETIGEGLLGLLGKRTRR